MRRSHMATLLFVCLCTAPDAQAQLGFLEKVFANITDVNVAYLIGRPLRGSELVSDQNGKLAMHGVGFEVAVALGPLLKTKPPSDCLGKGLKYKTTQRQIDTTRTAHGDSIHMTYIQTAEETPRYPEDFYGPPPKRELDEKRARAYDKRCNDAPSLDAELAFGYSQMGGFTGRDGLRVQGSIENLPAVGFYGVFSTDTWIDPYVGLRTGLAQLKGFQAFPGGTGRVTATGSTWQIGIAPGLSVSVPGTEASFFVEGEWMYRKFDDIQWTAVDGVVPAELRRPAHLSTFVLSIGGQIGIKKEK
jgi:hypothetical protein